MNQTKKNPFNPNSVVNPTLFGGRAIQIHQVIRKLAQIREGMLANFVIQGERGIGKTAFAKLCMFVAQGQDPELENLNLLTTYYTVEKNQSFRSVLQSSLNLLTDQLPKTSIDRLTTHLGDFFKKGKFTIGAFGLTAGIDQKTKTNEESFMLKDQAVSVLTNIIKGIEDDKKMSKKKGYDGILIVLDEIHNTKELSGIAQIFRNISTTLDMNGLSNISFMVIGYQEGIQQFFEGDPSAKRSFDSISLGIMPDVEAEEILTKGFKKVQVSYDKSLLKERIKDAGGYPHSIQVLGHNLIEADKDSHIDKEDWAKAIVETARELQSKDFSDMYDFEGKTTLREEVLNFLASRSEPISKTELAKIFDTKKQNIYIKSCLPKLKSLGAIKENTDTGNIDMQSTLFKSAIRLHLMSKLIKENLKIATQIEKKIIKRSKTKRKKHDYK